MPKKTQHKAIEARPDAAAYARIDALWKSTKNPKTATEITQYDWGYRDGVMSARALFSSEADADASKTKKGRMKRPL